MHTIYPSTTYYIQMSIMGSSMSLEERIAHDVKIIGRQTRALDREMMAMDREKKKLTYKLKKHAKDGNIDMVDALSTEFMVYKVNIKKLTKLKGKMSNVKQKIQLMRSVGDINRAIFTLTQTMQAMNQKMGISNINSMMMEYSIETNKMETSMEMMDDAMEDDIDEDEREEIVNSVLDEIGVEMAAYLKSTPMSDTGTKVEAILKSRLEKLLV
jgi:charged multivesicular body protein 2A